MKEKKIFKIVMIAVLCLFCLGLAGCTSREVKNVESAINSIGTENQADLSDIRAMYDALADDEKEQIENYSVLIAAENQHAATEVDDMIKSIGRNALIILVIGNHGAEEIGNGPHRGTVRKMLDDGRLRSCCNERLTQLLSVS